jgi:hypothetical protein
MWSIYTTPEKRIENALSFEDRIHLSFIFD